MDIVNYAGKVKTVKQNEILSTILNVEVAANDLDAGLESIINNAIDLSTQADRWVTTKGLKRAISTAGFRGDLVDTVRFGLATVKTLCPQITKMVKEYKETLWDGKLMTVKQANILNLIEYLNYWVKYSRMLFEVLLTMHNENTEPQRYLTGTDFKWINGTELFYRMFTLDLLKGSRQIMTNMSKLPDIDIEPTSLDILQATEGPGGVDALNKGFGIHTLNPLFWLGLGISKVQGLWIDKLRRDNEYFAMKISQAINKKNGTNDPDLDHRIEVYQDKIIKNEHTIAEIEAQYA
jgi:hypothetical protein